MTMTQQNESRRRRRRRRNEEEEEEEEEDGEEEEEEEEEEKEDAEGGDDILLIVAYPCHDIMVGYVTLTPSFPLLAGNICTTLHFEFSFHPMTLYVFLHHCFLIILYCSCPSLFRV